MSVGLEDISITESEQDCKSWILTALIRLVYSGSGPVSYLVFKSNRLVSFIDLLSPGTLSSFPCCYNWTSLSKEQHRIYTKNLWDL